MELTDIDIQEYHINGSVRMLTILINQKMLFSEISSFEWNQFTNEKPSEENIIYDSSEDDNGLLIGNCISVSCIKWIYEKLEQRFPTNYFIFYNNTLRVKW